MYTSIPSFEDTEVNITKVMYQYPKAWEFDFVSSGNERIMRGRFQSPLDGNDLIWRNIAKLQKQVF